MIWSSLTEFLIDHNFWISSNFIHFYIRFHRFLHQISSIIKVLSSIVGPTNKDLSSIVGPTNKDYHRSLFGNHGFISILYPSIFILSCVNRWAMAAMIVVFTDHQDFMWNANNDDDENSKDDASQLLSRL